MFSNEPVQVESFDHILTLDSFRNIPKKNLFRRKDHAIPYQSVQRSLLKRLCVPFAFQDKYRGNLHSDKQFLSDSDTV